MFVTVNQINAADIDLSYISESDSDRHLGDNTFIYADSIFAKKIACDSLKRAEFKEES